MLFRNLNTNEEVNVSNLTIKNGRIFFSVRGAGCGKKFFNRNTCLVLDEQAENGTYLKCAEGWEMIAGKRGRKGTPTPETPAQPETPTPSVEEAVDNVPETPVEEVAEVVPETPTPAQPTAQPETAGLNDALTTAFAPIFANVAKQIEANIRANVQGEIDALKAQVKTQVTRMEVITPNGEKHEVDGVFCEEFEDMVNDVNAGWFPYLHGAAGCGKSHTAEQIAKALGLDFYTQNMLNFAHEIAGYGDAGGNFVETPFFKAFSNGGLFFLDEADRSSIEGLPVLNQALQQGWFNFPVIGNVKAHPNFRFMCAGNTLMNGADEMYTSGQQQDASFKRRVIFYEMHYDRRIELPIMAQGDEILVNFVEDVRRAIKKTGTLHFVSYTETKYMKEHENMKEKALIRSTFKSLDIDIIRQIYGELEDKENVWAVAMYKLIRSRK